MADEKGEQLKSPEELGAMLQTTFESLIDKLGVKDREEVKKFLDEQAADEVAEAAKLIDVMQKRNLMSGMNWGLVKQAHRLFLERLWNLEDLPREAEIVYPLSDRLVRYDAYSSDGDSREEVEEAIRTYYAGDEEKFIDELMKLGFTKVERKTVSSREPMAGRRPRPEVEEE